MITIHNPDSQDVLEILGIEKERAEEFRSTIRDKFKSMFNLFHDVFQSGGEIPDISKMAIELHQSIADEAQTPNEVCLFTHIVTAETQMFHRAVMPMFQAQEELRRQQEMSDPAKKIITMDKKIIH